MVGLAKARPNKINSDKHLESFPNSESEGKRFFTTLETPLLKTPLTHPRRWIMITHTTQLAIN